DAERTIRRLAHDTGLGVPAVAGVFAALSPQVYWRDQLRRTPAFIRAELRRRSTGRHPGFRANLAKARAIVGRATPARVLARSPAGGAPAASRRSPPPAGGLASPWGPPATRPARPAPASRDPWPPTASWHAPTPRRRRSCGWNPPRFRRPYGSTGSPRRERRP